MKTLVDTSERVSKVSLNVFLPTFAMWTIELKKLEADLYPSFLRKLIDLVKVSFELCGHPNKFTKCYLI